MRYQFSSSGNLTIRRGGVVHPRRTAATCAPRAFRPTMDLASARVPNERATRSKLGRGRRGGQSRPPAISAGHHRRPNHLSRHPPSGVALVDPCQAHRWDRELRVPAPGGWSSPVACMSCSTTAPSSRWPRGMSCRSLPAPTPGSWEACRSLVAVVVTLLVRYRPQWLIRDVRLSSERRSINGRLSGDDRGEVARLARDGRKIEAIRLVRQRTGASLPRPKRSWRRTSRAQRPAEEERLRAACRATAGFTLR